MFRSVCCSTTFDTNNLICISNMQKRNCKRPKSNNKTSTFKLALYYLENVSVNLLKCMTACIESWTRLQYGEKSLNLLGTCQQIHFLCHLYCRPQVEFDVCMLRAVQVMDIPMLKDFINALVMDSLTYGKKLHKININTTYYHSCIDFQKIWKLLHGKMSKITWRSMASVRACLFFLLMGFGRWILQLIPAITSRKIIIIMERREANSCTPSETFVDYFLIRWSNLIMVICLSFYSFGRPRTYWDPSLQCWYRGIVECIS